jgi:lysophospholipase L1-like esterase
MSSVGPDPARTDRLPEETWESVARTRIYFGHMSVGSNILDGLRDLMRADGRARLDIVETSDPAIFKEAVFAHSPIGKNADPLAKIDQFRTILENGVGERADIAFFKLCFVDIEGGTDVPALIGAYDRAIGDLRAAYPKLTIPVVTAPLTAVPRGLKTSLKTLLGRSAPDKAANIKREAFNAHLRERYRRCVFDLAALESTRPSGERVTFETDGRTFYAMEPSYTDDGGHLNAVGRKVVAAELLRFLAGLGSGS